MRRRRMWWAMGAIGLAAVAGCGDGGSDEAVDDQAASTTLPVARDVDPASQGACDLLTADEVAGAVGVEVEGEPRMIDATCSIQLASDGFVNVGLQPPPDGEGNVDLMRDLGEDQEDLDGPWDAAIALANLGGGQTAVAERAGGAVTIVLDADLDVDEARRAVVALLQEAFAASGLATA